MPGGLRLIHQLELDQGLDGKLARSFTVVWPRPAPRDPLMPSRMPSAAASPPVVRHLHRLPPSIVPRRASRDSFLVHSCSPQLPEAGAIPRDAEGAVFHVAWTYSFVGAISGLRTDHSQCRRMIRLASTSTYGLCRGGSSSLTYSAVHRRNSCVSSHAHERNSTDGRISKPKPHGLGLQISRCLYSEMPPQDTVLRASPPPR